MYENGSLAYVLTDDGRLTPKEGGGYDCEYFIKDHLGNTRVTVWDSAGVAVVQQENHYYPFGMAMQGNSYQNENQENPNRYLYNGKEMQGDHGLEWLDYGARFYDATLGRFHVQDRFAEKYTFLSPYQYTANNPINNIDINGDSIWTTTKDGVTTFHITGKVLNVSSDKVDVKKIVSSFMSKMTDAIEGVEGFELDIQFEEAKSMDDVKDTDHLIAIVDDVEASEMIFDFTKGATKSKLKIAYVQGDLNEKDMVHTMIHEIGHNMGLADAKREDLYTNYMGYGTNFTESQLLWSRYLSREGELNKGSNHLKMRSKISIMPFFWRSTERLPFNKSLKKGDKIPMPIFK